ncbi:MAG: response regulator [Anaerolineales bacterium]
MEGRVLLIEDDAVNRQVLRERFEEYDIHIDEAEVGQEGINLATRLLPQAVIISTSLPDMRGRDVAKKLRSLTRTEHIYLMLLADDDVQSERLSGLEQGVDDFVASPFDPDEVMLRIRNALRRANSSNLMDPTTGLPATRLVQDQLRRLVQVPEGDWALLRFHISYLEAFREVYGFQAANDFLRDMGRILAEVLNKDAVVNDFLGYTGHDNFIVVTKQSRAAQFKDEVQQAFNEEVEKHYGFIERRQGYLEVDGERTPLASLRIWEITPADGPFYDIRSLSEALVG